MFSFVIRSKKNLDMVNKRLTSYKSDMEEKWSYDPSRVIYDLRIFCNHSI